jgi:hypothetical protein
MQWLPEGNSPLNVGDWHLTDVHADRYFGHYRGKNGHTASTREPTRLTQSSGKARYVTSFRDTAVKLPVKRIIVWPADGADERSRALNRRLQ